jgi:hypothetical protein
MDTSGADGVLAVVPRERGGSAERPSSPSAISCRVSPAHEDSVVRSRRRRRLLRAVRRQPLAVDARRRPLDEGGRVAAVARGGSNPPGRRRLDPLRQRLLCVAGGQDRAHGRDRAALRHQHSEFVGFHLSHHGARLQRNERPHSDVARWPLGLSHQRSLRGRRGLRRWVVAPRYAARRAPLGSRRDRPDLHLDGLRVPDLRPPLDCALSGAPARDDLRVTDAPALRRTRWARRDPRGDVPRVGAAHARPEPLRAGRRRHRARVPSARPADCRRRVPPRGSSRLPVHGRHLPDGPFQRHRVAPEPRERRGRRRPLRDDALLARQRRGHARVGALRQSVFRRPSTSGTPPGRPWARAAGIRS